MNKDILSDAFGVKCQNNLGFRNTIVIFLLILCLITFIFSIGCPGCQSFGEDKEMKEAYLSASSKDNVKDWKDFLEKYPKHPEKANIEKRITELEENEKKAYNLAKKEDSLKSWKDFISKYPDHAEKETIEKLIKELEEAENKSFKKAQKENTEEAYRILLINHPNHSQKENIEKKIEELYNDKFKNVPKNLREDAKKYFSTGKVYYIWLKGQRTAENKLIIDFNLIFQGKPIEFSTFCTFPVIDERSGEIKKMMISGFLDYKDSAKNGFGSIDIQTNIWRFKGKSKATILLYKKIEGEFLPIEDKMQIISNKLEVDIEF